MRLGEWKAGEGRSRETHGYHQAEQSISTRVPGFRQGLGAGACIWKEHPRRRKAFQDRNKQALERGDSK